MLKILQVRLQLYVNCELPDVQAGFRKGREARDQIANICWIVEKAKRYDTEIEENNRMGKARDLFKKIRDTREYFMQRWVQ